MKQCLKCKCNICGNMHNCEVIMDKIIDKDIKGIQCRPVLSCNNYKRDKDCSVYNSWVCSAKIN